MKEPIRMCESHDLPSALRDAFGALSRDAPSEDTVLRVQRALSALPAPLPGAAAAGTLGVGKLLVVVTLVAGALASALVLTRRSPAPRAERASDTISAAPTPAVLAPAEPALASPLSARAGGAMSAPDPARFAPRTSRAPASSQPRSAQRARADQRALPSKAEAPATAEQGTSEPAATSLPDPQVPSTQAPPASLANAQASEAQRLAQCKRLALRDPEQALRELEVLAQQLPNGALAQERELLAIRLHERLGHQATAAQLKQHFIERYPSSVYRRALAP